MERPDGDGVNRGPGSPAGPSPAGSRPALVTVGELRAGDDPVTCLRPLGLCELGGACEACWYRPDHPRHAG
ncbi:MAG: hypothetical protein MUC56_18095 [Thermoanaerobaculales bacterium]|jgi:hypothetical protein|nr:hypothetical protein [Thermoanaerobaculales bacterium]